MKIILVLLFTAFSLLAQEPMLRETPYKYVKPSIGKGKPHFLEIGSDSCQSCQIMGRTLYKVKQKNPQYNIEFINVQREREAAYELGVRMIPTQIIYDKDGKEVYRHIGLIGSRELHELFQKYNF